MAGEGFRQREMRPIEALGAQTGVYGVVAINGPGELLAVGQWIGGEVGQPIGTGQNRLSVFYYNDGGAWDIGQIKIGK